MYINFGFRLVVFFLVLVPNTYMYYACYIWVSLIAGMEYGMERWNGKWKGTVNVHSYS